MSSLPWRMRFEMPGVETMISTAGTRPVPAALGSRRWETTHLRVEASCWRIWACSPAGKAPTRRLMVETQSREWRVEKTRCPVSAAMMAVRMVSRSRISPTSRTSGSARRASRRASAKVGTSECSSRWWMTLRLF